MLNLNQKTNYHELNIDQLKACSLQCKKCDLSKERTTVVFGHGNLNADILIIGEGPGYEEDQQGKPFVGRSGKLLTELLQSANLNREKDIFITNTVKCRPPNNRTPLLNEINACKEYLIKQIQLIKPKILLLLGAPSTKTILKNYTSITKMRGKWYQNKVDYMKNHLLIMPIFHPAYLLRNPSKEEGKPKWLTQQDLQKVKEEITKFK